MCLETDLWDAIIGVGEQMNGISNEDTNSWVCLSNFVYHVSLLRLTNVSNLLSTSDYLSVTRLMVLSVLTTLSAAS